MAGPEDGEDREGVGLVGGEELGVAGGDGRFCGRSRVGFVVSGAACGRALSGR